MDWDDPLPDPIVRKWISIREELKGLAKLTVPRWFNTWKGSQIVLHGFSDASQHAMAAVIYITVFSPLMSQAHRIRLIVHLEASQRSSSGNSNYGGKDHHGSLAHLTVGQSNRRSHPIQLKRKFVARLKRKLDDPPANLLSVDALDNARMFWTQATQRLYFQEAMKMLSSGSKLPSVHPLSRLTAFIDAQGTLRVGGRLDNASLRVEERHPAILPREAQLSHLIVADAHQRTLHGGTQLTLSFVRRTHWIIGGMAPVKTHILKCVVCARQRGIRARQLMGQLPLSRVTPSRPFTHTGVDYAGPLILKTTKGRGSRTTKGWICVFVCLSTSAVHLEVVSDYTTQGFVAAYRRFVSRRGIARTLHSDCGTNFIGAEVELKKLFTASSREHKETASALSSDRTQWKFIPPASPHMGRKWEAVVRSIKFHLRRTVKGILLTFEEFSTLLAQIEAVLNSRPLEPLSDDSSDLTVLTPGHFLTGTALNSLPEPSLLDVSSNRLSTWQLIQQRLQRFWSQWSAHYLQRLQSISKWHHPSNEIKVGSLVLITHEHLPPSKWPLARVVEVHPSQDGLTRIATLKTATTTLTRPIVKLVVLPIPQ